MVQPDDLRGIIPALVTALDEDERIDEKGMRNLVRRALDAGCHGIFALGTMGEGTYLREEEKLRALEIILDEVAGRVPVFGNSSETSTTRSAELARRLSAAGADIVTATLPLNLPPSPEEMLTHFLTIADASDAPIAIYNAPGCTGSTVPVDVVVRLAEDPRFIATKDSTGDFGHVLDLLEAFRGHPTFRVLQGDELKAGVSIMMGCAGCVLGTPGNLVPRTTVQIYEAALRRDIDEVIRLQAIIKDAWRISFYPGASFIGNAKAALEMLGLCQKWTAKPFAMPDESVRAKIREHVDRMREYM
jgi:4-hydroxy-tetrahydrodipicolinate synthase